MNEFENGCDIARDGACGSDEAGAEKAGTEPAVAEPPRPPAEGDPEAEQASAPATSEEGEQ